MYKYGLFSLALCLFGLTSTLQAQSLLANGGFDNPDEPFAGWNIDYDWNKNSKEAGNHKRLKLVPSMGGKKNVVSFPEYGGAGTRIESRIIPFDPDAVYEATLDAEGVCRIYFSGYKWKPGVRPHDNPILGELRKIYKSDQEVTKGGWKKVRLQIPNNKKGSELQKKYLSKVRFITFQVWSEYGGHIDNVTIVKK